MPIKKRMGRKKTKANFTKDVKEYKLSSSDVKRLNNNQSIFMSTYSTNKNNNNIEDIYKVLNNKSFGMSKNKVLKDSSLKLNIHFENVGWRSMGSYREAGKYFETSEEYESLSGGTQNKIIGFSIHFVV